MAYEEEIDFQPIEQAIQDDLVSNALDVTSTPLTEDTEAKLKAALDGYTADFIKAHA